MRRAVVAALTAACAFLALWPKSSAVLAQAGPSQQPIPFTITAAGQSSGVFNLSGQSSCAVVVYNSGSGLVLVPQATSDTMVNIATGAAIWSTASNVGGGSITTFGNYVGNVAAVGLTGFRVTATALSSGTVQGSIYCSNASSASGGGTISGSVSLLPGTNSVGTVGLNAGTNSIGNVGLNAGTNSVGTVGLNAGTNLVGSFNVNNLPSPAPYIDIGVNPTATATPAAFDANNNLQTILGPNFQTAPTVTGALNASTISIPTNGMAAIRYSTLNSTLTGTPYTIQYQVSNDNTTWTTTNCLVLGSSSGSAYHTSQSGLEQGSCDVSRAAYWRATLSAFSGTAAGNLIVNYSFSAAPTPCLASANGACVALLIAGDTVTNTMAGFPSTSLNEIYNGASYFTRMYACIVTAQGTVTGTTETAVIAGVASKNIYICSYRIVLTGTNPTYQFANAASCGTGDTYFTPAFSIGASGGIDGFSFGQNSGWQTGTAANSICLKLTGTSAVGAYTIQYAQF